MASSTYSSDVDMANTIQSISVAVNQESRARSVDTPNVPVRLRPVAGIGLNTNIRDMIYYINKNEVIYAIGKHVAIQNIHNQKMTFFDPPSDNSTSNNTVAGEVTAMALTNKRDYFAVARGANSIALKTQSTISIYCLRSSKNTVKPTESQPRLDPVRNINHLTHSFATMAFSNNGKLLIAQSTTANWSFVLWDWTRARKIAVAEVHAKVTRIHFNPIDSAQMSTSGGIHLRLWKLAEPTCRQFATFSSANAAIKYIDHAWIPKSDGIVALLENGDVQHIFNGELIRTIASLHHGHYLSTLQTFKKSVVIGGNDGWISIFDVAEVDTNGAIAEITLIRRMQLDSKEPILAIAIDAAGVAIMCVTPTLYGAYDLSNISLLRGDDETISLVTFAPLPRLQATSLMVTSSRKHMFALLGTTYGGRTAMAIYGQEDTAGSLHYNFGHAVPICIDYHPSGYEAIVCYSVQLQIYHVLFDTIKLAFELELRRATNVAYNRGGNYFLALVEERFVYVYRNYDGIEPTLISVCKGHTNSISAIRWGANDSSFLTADERGDFRFWSLNHDEGFVSIQAHFDEKERHRTYEAIATAHDITSGQHLIAAAFTTDTGMSGLHTWADANLSIAPLKLEEFNSKIKCLEFSASSVLCVGLESGSLLIYWWEIVNDSSLKLSDKPLIYDLSVSPIVSLRSCLNERVLITTSSDGVAFSLQIAVNAPMPAISCPISPTAHIIESAFTSMCPADELCLVERASVTERILHIADLETEKEQLKIEKEIMSKLNAEQRTLLDRERQAEVRAVKTALESKIRSTEDQMQLKIDQANANAATLKARYEKDLNTMQTALTLKIETLNDICVKLEMDLIKAKQNVDDTLFSGEERCMLLRKELEREHKAALKMQRDEIDRLTKALDLKTREFDEVLSQQDEDQLTHLASMQAAIEQEKVHGKINSESAKNTISNLQQQLRMMLNALDIKTAEIDSLTAEKAQLNILVHSLQSELAAEKKKASKSVAECASLEAQVADLSRSLDGLERLNNIRLCKLKTIKDEMVQKEVEHDEMQAFAEELHAENSHIITDANAMDELTRQMQRKLKFYERTVETQKKSLAEVSAILTAFRRDLGILIEDEQNGCRLKIEAIVKLYHKYEPNSLKARNVKREMGTDEAIIQELTRQNKCVEDHRRKLRLRMDSAAMEKSKMAALISRDHQKLLDEVNRLTRENHELKRKAASCPVKQVDEPENNNAMHDAKQVLTPFVKREQAIVTKPQEMCRVYIPCGINVLNPPPAENTLKTIAQPLVRPKTSKPKAVPKAMPSNSSNTATARPKSALPKSTIRLIALP